MGGINKQKLRKEENEVNSTKKVEKKFPSSTRTVPTFSWFAAFETTPKPARRRRRRIDEIIVEEVCSCTLLPEFERRPQSQQKVGVSSGRASQEKLSPPLPFNLQDTILFYLSHMIERSGLYQTVCNKLSSRVLLQKKLP